MRELTLYEERKAEVANGPDVCFVQPMTTADHRDPLYAVLLPQDVGRFVLIDDPDGYEVMFKYRGRWRSLCGDCWLQTKSIEKDPCEAHYVNVVTFGRKILRRHKVKEMTWKEWLKRVGVESRTRRR